MIGFCRFSSRTAHDALTEEELDIYETPEAILSSERVPEGVYVGEVVESKNVRKARGRFKVRDMNDDVIDGMMYHIFIW